MKKEVGVLLATFNQLSKLFLPEIVCHIWFHGGDAKASDYVWSFWRKIQEEQVDLAGAISWKVKPARYKHTAPDM